MTTPYPEDIERKFINDYYFDCDSKYKREKLCRLRTNLAEGKCPKAETTIRAYCMWLYGLCGFEVLQVTNFNLYETYPHEFYGKKIPKCKKQIDKKQKKNKIDDFVLVEEEEKREEIKEEIKVPEKKLSPEKPPVQEKVKEEVKEEEDFHFQEDIVKTNDDWDPIKGQDYKDYYKAKDKIEGWIANKEDWRIKSDSWLQMFKNPTLFSKNCIKGYVRCILKQI